MSLLESIKTDGSVPNKDPAFPHAPADWTKEMALKTAKQEGLELGADHWEAVRALRSISPSIRRSLSACVSCTMRSM